MVNGSRYAERQWTGVRLNNIRPRNSGWLCEPVIVAEGPVRRSNMKVEGRRGPQHFTDG